MEKLATENLFLFEFLVDDVQLDEKCDCETPPGDLCVSFQFLDNDALDVCEPDTKKKADNTKSGKSCLFSLTAEQIVKALEVFDVTVSVFKKMQPGWLPDKILVGEALISVANLFTELVENVESRCDQGPAAKTLKDMFNLTDSNGGPAGRVGVYVRMSCFGKLIVTQFQMNLDDKSVLFKDKGGQSLYRYKKAKKNDPNRRESILTPCDATASTPSNAPPNSQVRLNASNVNQAMPVESTTYPRNASCPAQSCYDDMYTGGGGGGGYMGGEQQGGGMYGGYGQPPPQSCPLYGPPQQQQQQVPPQQQQYGNYPACCMPEGNNGQMVSPCIECGSMLPPQFQEPAPCPPCVDSGAGAVDPPGHYQEIGASMGGNALTIRVHKDKNKIEQVDGEGSCCQMGAGSPKAGVTSSSAAQCFALQPGPAQGDKNLPFSFKVSGHPTAGGAAGGGGAGNITINPPVCSKPDGTKYTEISDPDKEVFVLRIGKKSEGVQKKANLELELCTPRGPEIKPIPKKETRDSQYDPSDCKDADGGGKGKKGKGGKKDKKGKKGGGKGKGKKKK